MSTTRVIITAILISPYFLILILGWLISQILWKIGEPSAFFFDKHGKQLMEAAFPVLRETSCKR